MEDGKIAEMLRLRAMPVLLSGAVVALALSLVVISGSAAFGAAQHSRGWHQVLGDEESDSPGTMQQRPNAGEPSEDETDDPPSAASPDAAAPEPLPGCIFHEGPLNLVV